MNTKPKTKGEWEAYVFALHATIEKECVITGDESIPVLRQKAKTLEQRCRHLELELPEFDPILARYVDNL